MKKLFSILFLCSYLVAQDIQAPPAMPSMEQLKNKEKTPSKKKSSNSACESIPPMLHMLPPPLQNSLDKCQIEKFMPTKKEVKRYLKTNKIEYKSIGIKPAKEFIRVYKIELGNGKRLFCNETVTRCLEP
ncbi:MAG: hypothetical protein ACQERD_07005 [Campylobacterota bacterium]